MVRSAHFVIDRHSAVRRITERKLTCLPASVRTRQTVTPRYGRAINGRCRARGTRIVRSPVICARVPRNVVADGNLSRIDPEFFICNCTVIVARRTDNRTDNISARLRREPARPARNAGIIRPGEILGKNRILISRLAERCRRLRRRDRLTVRPGTAVRNGYTIARRRIHRPGEDGRRTIRPNIVSAVLEGNGDRITSRIGCVQDDCIAIPFPFCREVHVRRYAHCDGIKPDNGVILLQTAVRRFRMRQGRSLQRRLRDRELRIGNRTAKTLPYVARIECTHPIVACIVGTNGGIHCAGRCSVSRADSIGEDDLRHIAVGQRENITETRSLRPCGRLAVNPAEFGILCKFKRIDRCGNFKRNGGFVSFRKGVVIEVAAADRDDYGIGRNCAVHADDIAVSRSRLLQNARIRADRRLRADHKNACDQSVNVARIAVKTRKHQIIGMFVDSAVILDRQFIPINVQKSLCNIVREVFRVRIVVRKRIIGIRDLNARKIFSRKRRYRLRPIKG